jgi:Zn-dependent protease with chaperone function
MSAPDLKRDFLKVLLLPALTFLLVPLGSIGFARYGESKIDDIIFENIQQSIATDATMTADDRAAATEFYRAHPASSVCDDADPQLAQYREAACKPFDEVWQFLWAERLGWWMAALGLAAFLFIGVLSFIAYQNRNAQYWTFMLGWRGLVVVTALETAVQGVLAVWLSYWVTALLFNIYVPKLIIVVAIMAGWAVIAIVRALFKGVPPPLPFEAEQVQETDAPALWQRVRELASRLGTPAPRAIVAGIDDNFFVTENGLSLVDGKKLEGRTLYLSLPLLRVLAPSEADAVFSHELAHFRGGDTEASAKLQPALVRYEQYWASLVEGGVTAPASYVMRLYRALFELALKKEQRRRELVADAEAAKLTSPDDLGRSLLKVAGYSSFRNHTEAELFQHRETHQSELGLQARIDAGLPGHVASANFLAAVKEMRIPHPFDSHPPLEERFANVKSTVRVEDSARLFDTRPARTWADEVLTGRGIEERLWGAYEARFKANHEQSLAYRYLPATDEERRLVLRFFPDQSFTMKDGTTVRVTYVGLTLPDGEQIAFRDVTGAKVEDGNFSTQLTITHGDKKKSKVNLGHLKTQAEPFKAAFAQYWQRDQVARQSSVAPQG